MKIKRLTATFGRLENETLRLEPGLNIIEAPNERGKSTWTAFLRVMLYGLNTRDRSANADKRRYLPWSGSAMQGVLEADTCLGDVTITRSTARANAPMGAFSAVHTGTSEPVAGLTAAGCGEALLGVPMEVYERSAYIRQSGLAVDQNAALERRIAALITTGEEDTSYTDAADRLRLQLTRRRYNKTGLLPQAERELEELERTAAEGRTLEESCRRWEAELEAAQAQNAALTADLRRHDQADAAQAIAEALHAHRLVFLTDVGGILIDSHNTKTAVAHMDAQRARELMDAGLIAGGMVPKVQGCLHALEAGVGEVSILDGHCEHVLLLDVLHQRVSGTILTP